MDVDSIGLLSLFAQQGKGGGGGAGGAGILAGLFAYFVIVFVLFIITVIGRWKAFEKAGQPGWAGIVPIYEFYIRAQLAKKESPWFILYVVGILVCLPLWIVAEFIVTIEYAKKYDRSAGFGIGLVLLPYIFYPILGFGSSEFVGRRRRDYDDDDDDEEEEEERPRRRSRAQDEDDEEERPRPRGRNKRDEDEEEERPRGRNKRDEDDEDEERPRRPRR
ncbi:MAG: hypothetical protein K2V38_02295 [Gemmataceae bacterium]|nr:hypothetical protein [Gemmataceae bacterium]